MSLKNNLPVPQAPPAPPIAAIVPAGLPDWFSPGGGAGYLTSLPIDSEESFALCSKAAVTRDKLLKDCKNLEIDLTHWFASPWDGVDEETGEEKSSVRLALIDAKGAIYVTYSPWVRKTLMVLMGRFGMAGWNPPVRVRVYGEACSFKRGNELVQGEKLLIEYVPPKGGKRS